MIFINTNSISLSEILKNEYSVRKSNNSAYSLRAFARDLGISRTAVSEAVKGTRKLSSRNLEILGQNLNLGDDLISSLKNDSIEYFDTERILFKDSELDFIEDWFYLAILSLARLPSAIYDEKWVANRLGLKEEVAKNALEYLSSKNYIENVEGRLIRKITPITTTSDIPSSSIVESHRQSIHKAIEALEEVTVDLREFTSVTYAINREQLPEVKKQILNFHRQLGKSFEDQNSNEVYRLNIQFFPLTKTYEN